MPKSLDEVLLKLDHFIKKYYLNQMIRGGIYFFSWSLVILLSVLILEYFGKFNSLARTFLFYAALITLLSILFRLILRPLFKYLSLGKTIGKDEAAKIIGKHFSEVSDKLSNLLQLKEIAQQRESDLLLASIEQKSAELRPIPFSLAINLGDNSRYLKYLGVPLFVFLSIYLFEPAIIAESSGRLIAHSQDFKPSAPYSLNIENQKLTAFKNEDFTLKVSAQGREIPARLSVVVNGEEYLMKQNAKGSFQYTFKNLQKEKSFYLTDGQFDSPDYQIKVVVPPTLLEFKIEANYPPYLKKRPEIFKNTGDLTVPEGSQLKWLVNTEATTEVFMLQADSNYSFVPSAEDEFKFDQYFYNNTVYKLILKSQELDYSDTVAYRVNVIPDMSPSITLQAKGDSSSFSRMYFEGIVKDDYGFSGLYFHYQLTKDGDSLERKERIEIPINLDLIQSRYYYAWDIAQLNLKAGENIRYYFEIWDNDGVNGRKSARTQTNYFKKPSKKEISKKTEQSSQEIKDELERNIELSQEINKELEKLKQKMLNKKELGFQEKKQLENILEKQKQLKNSVEKIQKQQKENNQLNKEFNQLDESLVEKQKQLEDLFEKIMSDEMKELMAEMEKLMEEFQKDQLQNALEEMELSNEQLEKELDRNLELFKQLEVEKELAESIEQLEEIKKEQDQLKEKSSDKRQDKEELAKEQDELNKDFEELTEKLENLEKKNQELEQPNKMEDTKALEEQIKQDMEESKEELSKGDRSNAEQKQQESSEGMQELSESLSNMQMQMQSQQAGENLEDLRALLENLITLSFDQEELMEELRTTERDDPRYVDLAQDQRKLQDDSKLIQDSLFALSKRVMALESIVNKEISSINYNMGKAIEFMGERATSLANSRQQLSMTSINNLALLLDEAVQNMQAQMQSQGKCDKPGQGKPKPGEGQKAGNLKKLQEQLNKQLESLKKSMEEGKKPGEKPGQSGMPGMSKEIAQMAAKQAAIRRSLEKLQEQIAEGESSSEGRGNLRKLADLMEQTETDLVNKSITNETLLRQQEILSRLLQSEKAEREREKEERRESKEFTDEINRNPNSFLEYNRRKEREVELLQTLPPSFSPFYKNKVTEYFNKIEQ